MSTFIAAFVLLLVIVAAMAIGVLFGRSAIKGSCGGLNQVGVDYMLTTGRFCADGRVPAP